MSEIQISFVIGTVDINYKIDHLVLNKLEQNTKKNKKIEIFE